MRLLDTTTFELVNFKDDRELNYAVLSHRWTEDEVLFQDFQDGGVPSKRAAWPKVEKACEQAKADSYPYIWIDTCCIDETSSAELSETVNSIYRWYQNSGICYAYLNDVVDADLGADFSASEWFRRGWTLPELIAPRHMMFYNLEWQMLGDRGYLARQISGITKIPEGFLAGMGHLDDFSVAQRMSWASQRITTRAEDAAYSLMGIFNVNMPILYGEGGERAFIRLQEEIMKDSDDHSIFAWKLHNCNTYSGLLAQSVSSFAECTNTRSVSNPDKPPYMKTNLGLQISLVVRHYLMDVYVAALDCEELIEGKIQRVGIFLSFPKEARFANRPGRVAFPHCDRVEFPATNGAPYGFLQGFNIIKTPFPHCEPVMRHFGFVIAEFQMTDGREMFNIERGFIRVVARPSSWDNYDDTVTLPPDSTGTALGFAMLDPRGVPRLVAKIGFDTHFQPWVWVTSTRELPRPVKWKTAPAPITRGQVFDDMVSVSLVDVRSFDSMSVLQTVREKKVKKGTVWVADRRQGLYTGSDPNLTISRFEHPDLGWTWKARIMVKIQVPLKNIRV